MVWQGNYSEEDAPEGQVRRRRARVRVLVQGRAVPGCGVGLTVMDRRIVLAAHVAGGEEGG